MAKVGTPPQNQPLNAPRPTADTAPSAGAEVDPSGRTSTTTVNPPAKKPSWGSTPTASATGADATTLTPSQNPFVETLRAAAAGGSVAPPETKRALQEFEAVSRKLEQQSSDLPALAPGQGIVATTGRDSRVVYKVLEVKRDKVTLLDRRQSPEQRVVMFHAELAKLFPLEPAPSPATVYSVRVTDDVTAETVASPRKELISQLAEIALNTYQGHIANRAKKDPVFRAVHAKSEALARRYADLQRESAQLGAAQAQWSRDHLGGLSTSPHASLLATVERGLDAVARAQANLVSGKPLGEGALQGRDPVLDELIAVKPEATPRQVLTLALEKRAERVALEARVHQPEAAAFVYQLTVRPYLSLATPGTGSVEADEDGKPSLTAVVNQFIERGLIENGGRVVLCSSDLAALLPQLREKWPAVSTRWAHLKYGGSISSGKKGPPFDEATFRNELARLGRLDGEPERAAMLDGPLARAQKEIAALNASSFGKAMAGFVGSIAEILDSKETWAMIAVGAMTRGFGSLARAEHLIDLARKGQLTAKAVRGFAESSAAEGVAFQAGMNAFNSVRGASDLVDISLQAHAQSVMLMTALSGLGGVHAARLARIGDNTVARAVQHGRHLGLEAGAMTALGGLEGLANDNPQSFTEMLRHNFQFLLAMRLVSLGQNVFKGRKEPAWAALDGTVLDAERTFLGAPNAQNAKNWVSALRELERAMRGEAVTDTVGAPGLKRYTDDVRNEMRQTSDRMTQAVKRAQKSGSPVVVDLVGVGAGPHNAAVLGGLREANPRARALFLEQSETFGKFDELGDTFDVNTPEEANRSGNVLPGSPGQVRDVRAAPPSRASGEKFYPGGSLGDATMLGYYANDGRVLFGQRVKRIVFLGDEAKPAPFRIETQAGLVVYARNVTVGTGLGAPRIEIGEPATDALANSRVGEARAARASGSLDFDARFDTVDDLLKNVKHAREKGVESLAHLKGKRVLVIGGGDGGAIACEALLAGRREDSPALMWAGQKSSDAKSFGESFTDPTKAQRYSPLGDKLDAKRQHRPGTISPYDSRVQRIEEQRRENGTTEYKVTFADGKTVITDNVVYAAGYTTEALPLLRELSAQPMQLRPLVGDANGFTTNYRGVEGEVELGTQVVSKDGPLNLFIVGQAANPKISDAERNAAVGAFIEVLGARSATIGAAIGKSTVQNKRPKALKGAAQGSYTFTIGPPLTPTMSSTDSAATLLAAKVAVTRAFKHYTVSPEVQELRLSFRQDGPRVRVEVSGLEPSAGDQLARDLSLDDALTRRFAEFAAGAPDAVITVPLDGQGRIAPHRLTIASPNATSALPGKRPLSRKFGDFIAKLADVKVAGAGEKETIQRIERLLTQLEDPKQPVISRAAAHRAIEDAAKGLPPELGAAAKELIDRTGGEIEKQAQARLNELGAKVDEKTIGAKLELLAGLASNGSAQLRALARPELDRVLEASLSVPQTRAQALALVTQAPIETESKPVLHRLVELALEPESATSDLAAAALDGQMRHSPANQSEVVKRLRAIGFEAATPAMSKRALTLMRVLADAHGQPTVGQSRISAASNVVLWGLAAGETAMPHAPEVRAGSASVVPEAYKLFNHTVDSVQNLVAGIDYDPHFRVFVLEGAEGPVIQVGIVGRENYPYNADHPEKMVYGRRWRVEKYFPTSEIYQTVMLALQKAEEHEVRELFRYRKSTPYTGHVDFEVLKKLVPTIENSSAAHADKTSVQRLLDDVSFGGHKLKLVTVQQRPNGSTVYEVRFEREPNAKRALEEYDDQVLTFVADGNKSSQILSSLMDTLIGRTRRKVEEGLRIDGFPRFSHDISPDTLRDASVAVWRDARREAAPEFAEIERALEYGVAEARAPVLPDGAANRRAYEVVEEKDLEGVMPTRQNSTNKI